MGVAEVLLMSVRTVPTGTVTPRLLKKAKVPPGLIVTPFATTSPIVRFRSSPTLKKPSDLKVKRSRRVSVPGCVKLWPGVRKEPFPGVSLPTTTRPAIVPVPPRAPEKTRTGPVPVADPFVLCTRRVPSWCITRSEEHTSELQSRLHLVCRLLLEKKQEKDKRRSIRPNAVHTPPEK